MTIKSSSFRTSSGPWIDKEYTRGLVSVIIPTYNRAEFLLEAIDSVFAQTYRPIELLIVDDGSTDHTREALAEWHTRCPTDGRFKFSYLHQQNKGAQVARNFGLTQSRGEYIQFLDSDDVLSPGKLASQVTALPLSSPQTAAHGPARLFENVSGGLALYEPPRLVTGNTPLKRWTKGLFVPPHSLLWRRQDIMKSGPWDESLTADQDGEYIMRFLGSGGNLLFCEDAWVYYRQSSDYSTPGPHLSGKRTAQAIRSRIRVIRRLERFLTSNELLDDEYRDAISRRYYWIAKNWAIRHSTLRQLCLRDFKRLSLNGSLPGTLQHRLLTGLLGIVLTEKLRHFFRGVLRIPFRSPVVVVKTIREVCTFDQRAS